jgi:hypothetical protein
VARWRRAAARVNSQRAISDLKKSNTTLHTVGAEAGKVGRGWGGEGRGRGTMSFDGARRVRLFGSYLCTCHETTLSVFMS